MGVGRLSTDLGMKAVIEIPLKPTPTREFHVRVRVYAYY